jgi:predicted component of type VI protein secretion system
MKAELVPENGDPPIQIVRDVTVLGRHEDCDVVIEHSSLSKRHCLLVKTDGLLVIRDLATTNGTKVKGQRVRWAALLPEDRVSFGAYKMRIYLGSDEMPSPSEQRRARNGGAGAGTGTGSRTPGATRPAGQGLYPAVKKSALAPPLKGARPLPSSFPEPSHDGTAAAEWEDTAYVPETSGNPVGAEPILLNGGFELVEENAHAGKSSAGVFEGGFELVEDDDDIIELD